MSERTNNSDQVKECLEQYNHEGWEHSRIGKQDRMIPLPPRLYQYSIDVRLKYKK